MENTTCRGKESLRGCSDAWDTYNLISLLCILVMLYIHGSLSTQLLGHGLKMNSVLSIAAALQKTRRRTSSPAIILLHNFAAREVVSRELPFASSSVTVADPEIPPTVVTTLFMYVADRSAISLAAVTFVRTLTLDVFCGALWGP